MSIKPLIKVSTIKGETYLPNRPTYTLAETAKIKKFIPKLLAFSGLDCHGGEESQGQQLERQKLKVKGVSGRDISLDTQLKFLNKSDFSLKIWNDVAICLNIPYNNRQSLQDEKQQLDSKIQLCVENKLYFVDKNGQEILKSSPKLISLEDVGVFFHPSETNSENFDNSYRQIRFSMAIGVLLHKKEAYSISQLQNAIKGDLVNSLKIMIKNKLPIRILRAVFNRERVLILQSFVNRYEEVASQSKKLDEILNKSASSKEIAQKQPQKAIECQKQLENSQQNPKKQLSNRQLMMILFGLFLIYIFLKLNPLQKILSQSL